MCNEFQKKYDFAITNNYIGRVNKSSFNTNDPLIYFGAAHLSFHSVEALVLIKHDIFTHDTDMLSCENEHQSINPLIYQLIIQSSNQIIIQHNNKNNEIQILMEVCGITCLICPF